MNDPLFELKLKTYKEQRTPLHLTLENKNWVNCYVVKILKDHFIAQEYFNKNLMPIYFKDIFDMRIYKKLEVK